MAPMIAVRFSGGRAAAKKALRGATSMLCEQARRIRKAKAAGRAEGTGMSARQMADGRWVKTIVCEIVRNLNDRKKMQLKAKSEP